MMYLDVAADGCNVILCLQAFGYRFGKIPLNASTTSSWCWAVQQQRYMHEIHAEMSSCD